MDKISTKHTPGPWHVDRGQVQNSDGDLLATYPFTLGDESDHANGLLMAAAPDLLAAAILTLEALGEMDTEAFSRGADKPARDALRAAIRRYMPDFDKE